TQIERGWLGGSGAPSPSGCSVEARMTWVPGVISPKEGPLTCATAGMSNGSPLAARFAPTAASCSRAGAKPTGPFQAAEVACVDQLAPVLVPWATRLPISKKPPKLSTTALTPRPATAQG